MPTLYRMKRRVATLKNRCAEKLHCILEEPAGGATGARFAVLLLCPGIKTRVAPHRLYRKLLAPFLARGIPVMRVDFAGLGDSEGEWPDDVIEQIYRRTELGHCVDDVRAVFDWLETHCGIRRFIAGGLCGAAITALHVASQDSRFAALYAIGLPAILHGSGMEHRPGRSELRAHRLLYLRKMLHPRSWLRFFSMKSDYGLMWRLVADAVRTRAASASHTDKRSSGAQPGDDFNRYLPPAFFDMLAEGRPALLMYGEDDPMRHSFEERFMEPWWSALERYKALFSYAVIPGTNHILGEPAAIVEANRLTGLWLDGALLGHSQSRGLGWRGVSPPDQRLVQAA